MKKVNKNPVLAAKQRHEIKHMLLLKILSFIKLNFKYVFFTAALSILAIYIGEMLGRYIAYILWGQEMKKDVFEEYSILVDGLYKGQVSYIFEEMINALRNNNKVMLFTLDMERLMDYVLELNNKIQALELENRQCK